MPVIAKKSFALWRSPYEFYKFSGRDNAPVLALPCDSARDLLSAFPVTSDLI
jgi:hypothetical protein